MRHTLIPAIALIMSLPLLSGCASVVVGGAAAAGVAAYQERGIDGVARDTATATRLRAALLEEDEILFRDVGIDVYEGRALMTGRVANEDMRADAIRLAWSTDGVKDVINEINVSPNPLADMANDAWISAQLKSTITFDTKILAINYSIETVGGVVYLIGIAQSQAELDLVMNHARNISYVRRVVSHVRIKDPAPKGTGA